MSRGLYLRGATWWLSISYAGQRFRGSTGICGGKPGKPPRDAEMFRARKLAEFGKGNVSAMDADRVTIAELVQSLLDRQRAEGRIGVENVVDRTRRFIEWYGGWRAVQFTPDRMLAYALRRREAGAAVATVNTEIAYLRRAYAIAAENGRLFYIPHFRRLPGANKRFGTIDDATLALILAEILPVYRPVLEFLRLTGWRRNEACRLEWWRVDWQNQQIRLDTSKTGRPRAVPWTTYPQLGELLERQRGAADSIQREHGVVVARVFHTAKGGPLSENGLFNAWARACTKAGVHGVPRADGTPTRPLIHDLRRSLNSEMDRRGVPWSVQKAVTGHESDRQHGDYVIAPRRDVEEGLKKLAEAKQNEPVLGFLRRQ